MKKTRLLALLEAIRARVPLECPLVTGSQSAHAMDAAETPAVEASLEVDLLLIGKQFQHRHVINEEFGEQSAFFRQNGTYVHAIGIGIVSLPAGWETRLKRIPDAAGRTIAQAVEIHDTLAAKLMAAREKDFDFLRELLDRNLFDFTTMVRRFLLLRASPFGNAVPDRLLKLDAALRAWGRSDLAEALQQMLRT